MDKKQLIDMAHKCGAVGVYNDPKPGDLYITMDADSIERFATLVAAHEREQWQADAQRWRDVAAQGSAQMHCLIGGSYSFNLPKDKAKADDFADNLPIVRDRARGEVTPTR